MCLQLNADPHHDSLKSSELRLPESRDQLVTDSFACKQRQQQWVLSVEAFFSSTSPDCEVSVFQHPHKSLCDTLFPYIQSHRSCPEDTPQRLEPQ